MPSDDPIEVLIAHAQSLCDAWPRYAALAQTQDPRMLPAEIMRQRFTDERGEHIIGPDSRLYEIELAIVEDFRCACAARRYSTKGRASGSLSETPLPADLYQNARLRIEQGELLLYPPRQPRPIKIVRVAAVPPATIRLSPERDLMLDQAGNMAMLSGDAAIEQDAESAGRHFEAKASQAAAVVAAIKARHSAAEAASPVTAPEPAPAAPDRTGLPGRPSKSKDLINDEFERRIADREASLVLAEEARTLLDWLAAKYPTAARPTLKTIQNNIRDRHRRYANRPFEAATAKRPKL